MKALKGLVLTILSCSAPAGAAELEIRFCPADKARSYPLDTAHNVTSLVVQGIALINRGSREVTLDTVTIELLQGDAALDQRTIGAAELSRAAASGKALADSGMMAAIGFQFCDGRLLGNATLSADATLTPGEALMLSHQTFAWRGGRNAARVRAAGSSATISIDGSFAAPPIKWPLKGGAWALAGASFHTTHRWAVPEQFAFDIVKLGPDGRTHRGTGEHLSDFHAYGAPVIAAAAGKVVKVFQAKSEDAPMLRRQGESMDSYFARIGAVQAAKLAGGEAAIIGEGIIIDQGQDVFAAYVHLKPGSAAVKVGDSVTSGQQIGMLGNSGNSTEPHLHFQLCDKPSGLSCAGIPPQFDGIELPLADGPRPLQSGDIVIAD